MTAYELIQKKQQGKELTRAELQFLITGLIDGTVPDYQVSAWLMSVFFQGMATEETYHLTDLMRRSGEVIDLSHLTSRKVDKHSTGGVGDKVTLILAPIVAAAGVPVPMISGRGLGHTGGTLDKLESIPGFRTDLSTTQFIRQVEELNLSIISQSESLVPADKLLYALRDVTATVASVPLITGSILSKKLAEGIDALVLDVKVGSGAIFRTLEEALALTRSLMRIGQRAGLQMATLVSQMDQPLGNTIGNWNEVLESVDALQGVWPADLEEVTLTLAGLMFELTGRTNSMDEGIRLAREQIESGAAWDLFQRFVSAQGGKVEYLHDRTLYPEPAHRLQINAAKSGIVQLINARELGLLSVSMGAGRRKMDDDIDFTAGIRLNIKTGDRVQKGEPIGELCHSRSTEEKLFLERLYSAILISDHPTAPLPTVLKVIRPDDAIMDSSDPTS